MTRRRFCSPAHRHLADWACPRGWSWAVTPGGHIRWFHPAVAVPVFTSATPSDIRAVAKAKAQFKRALPERRRPDA